MKTCQICKVQSFEYAEVEHHSMGCPVIWEQIYRIAGDYRKAQLCKDLLDEFNELMNEVRIQDVA